jgi:putative ABC transport system substrate-binding protein
VNRRAFLTGAVLAVSRVAEGQPRANEGSRIGILVEGPRDGFLLYQTVLERTFRELGYVERRNVSFEYRFAGGEPQQLLRSAHELVRLPVDVLLTPSNAAIAAARQATTTIPIVMILAANPVRAKFVETLARPGANITGLTADAAPETILGKQLGLLREVLPRLSRISVLWNPDVPAYRDYVRDAAPLIKAVGIELQSVEARLAINLQHAFEAMRRDRANAFVVMPDDFTFTHRHRIADLAVKHRIPGICYLREFAEAGCLMSYGVNISDLYRRAPFYVDRILKGAKPAELPVEQPSVFETVVNLKTARSLGLTIPPTVLLRADQVIE